MNEWVNTTITVVSSALTGGGLTALVNSQLKKRQIDKEQAREDKQQPVDQLGAVLKEVHGTYSAMLDASEARRVAAVAELVGRLDRMDTALANCLQSHVTDAEDRGFLKGRVDELSRQLNITASATTAAKETAIAANTKADAAMDASQTALVNLPPPEHK